MWITDEDGSETTIVGILTKKGGGKIGGVWKGKVTEWDKAN